jgi:sugar phosphate isomerase/epimerase
MNTGFITFEGISYDEGIPTAAQLGFDHVELMMPYAPDRTELGREYLTRHADAIRETAAAAEVDLLVHLPHALDVGSPAERVRSASVEELKACLDTVAAVGADKAVVHPTSTARERTWTDGVVRDWILESIREVDDYGETRDVEVCMENIPGSRFELGDFDRFFADTECSMTLDTGHARISGHAEERIAEFLDAHQQRVSHVHVNDNKQFLVGDTGRPADDHVPTGSGDLDFVQLFTVLAATDWEGTLSLEVQTGNLDYIAVSKDQLDTMLETARTAVHE